MGIDARTSAAPVASTRRLARSCLVVLALLLAGPPEADAQCATAPNPIVCENTLAGSTAWQIDGPIATDSGAQIQGYASATSVDTGDVIDLHVTVAGGSTWRLEIYRMGWYGGAGGRLMRAVALLPGVDQGGCVDGADVNDSYVCSWPVAAGGYSLSVPTTWTTGLYLAKLENETTNHQAYVPFVVREDDRDGDYYYQQAVMTYQAYNRWPGNDVSFYSGGSAPSPWLKTLSFARPYASRRFLRNNESPFDALGDGSGGFFTWDFPMIQWLEREGYDVSYATNVDFHLNPDRALDFRAMISVGHDEYWTEEMAAAASAARDAGVDLAFFAGNHVFGTVSYDDATRKMTGLTKAGPSPANSGYSTVDPDKTKRQALLGQANTGCCVRKPVTYYNVPWIVGDASHWVFAGTGFEGDDVVPHLLGYEPDAYDPNFVGACSQDFTLLSDSPFTPAAAGGGTDTSWLNSWPLDSAHSTIYQAPRGAWVFSAGSTDWPWGLATPFAVGIPEYDASRGNGQPTGQGFTLVGANGVDGVLVNDLGQPAWQVDAGVNETSLWEATPRAEGMERQGSVAGTTTRAEIRIVSGDWITFYEASDGHRFLVKFRLDGPPGSESLRVDLRADDATNQTGIVVATGGAATDWHVHEIRHDPVADEARYFLDGSPIGLAWNGEATTNAGLYFGQGSTPVAGSARFRNVSHGPTTPIAPDARIQAMTKNVLDAMGDAVDWTVPIFYEADFCEESRPARLGWTDSLSLEGVGALVDDLGAPAWEANGTGGRATWYWVPNPETEALLPTNHWRLASELRLVSGGFVTNYYADGARRFLPILQLDAKGDLAVQLEGGGFHVLATGAAATDYHVHEVIFNPASGRAVYVFDGQPIEIWDGASTAQHQIAFGQGSSFVSGIARYRSMRFEPVPEPAGSALWVVASLGLLGIGRCRARRDAGGEQRGAGRRGDATRERSRSRSRPETRAFWAGR